MTTLKYPLLLIDLGHVGPNGLPMSDDPVFQRELEICKKEGFDLTIRNGTVSLGFDQDQMVPYWIEKETAPKAAPEKSASPKAGTQKLEPAENSQIKKPAKKKGKVAVVAPTNAAGPVYTIQAASVKDPKDADRLVEKLKKSGYPAYRAIGKIPGKGIWFRVRIGEYKRKSDALSVMNKMKKEGLKPILVMK